LKKLLETFKHIGKLKPTNEHELLSSIKRIEKPAKSLLQEQDCICNKIYFIESGIARTFYYKDGKDITYWIGLEDDFIGSMSSFFMREQSNKMVETIEDCVLWEFEYHSLETLFSSSLELQKVGRLFANYGISLMEKRFDNLHFNTAKERYDILLFKQPEILQRVPLGMIASYLGITQETLSRIRKQK